MPPGAAYAVDVIDTWNMTVETLARHGRGHFRVDCPAASTWPSGCGGHEGAASVPSTDMTNRSADVSDAAGDLIAARPRRAPARPPRARRPLRASPRGASGSARRARACPGRWRRTPRGGRRRRTRSRSATGRRAPCVVRPRRVGRVRARRLAGARRCARGAAPRTRARVGAAAAEPSAWSAGGAGRGRPARARRLDRAADRAGLGRGHVGRPAVPCCGALRRCAARSPRPAVRTAHGVYELELNGARVGDHVLAPGLDELRHRLRYQTFDVTALLRPAQRARRAAGRRLVPRPARLQRRPRARVRRPHACWSSWRVA
jgi:hypothetical protein